MIMASRRPPNSSRMIRSSTTESTQLQQQVTSDSGMSSSLRCILQDPPSGRISDPHGAVSAELLGADVSAAPLGRLLDLLH
jgi:hypothetical protein